jgi:hypothetical protein
MICGETPASASNVAPSVCMNCPTIYVLNRDQRCVIKNKCVGTVPPSLSQSSGLLGNSESCDLRYAMNGL